MDCGAVGFANFIRVDSRKRCVLYLIHIVTVSLHSAKLSGYICQYQDYVCSRLEVGSFFPKSPFFFFVAIRSTSQTGNI